MTGWGDCGLGGRAADEDDWDDGNGQGGGRDCCSRCWEGGKGGDGMTGSEKTKMLQIGFKRGFQSGLKLEFQRSFKPEFQSRF